MHLKDLALADAVHHLTLPPQQPPQSSSTLLPSNPDIEQPSNTSDTTDKPVTHLLSPMSSEEIASHLHHPGTSYPSVEPCDTANASNTKTHWSAEELYCIMGCCKFKNYKHLLQVSQDRKWINGGKFPFSLGSYATIPKAKWGGLLNRRKYYYLDAMHMDIAFRDCVNVGGFCYSLILVNQAIHYNWTFGLKSLSSVDIISALCLFQAAVGLLACCFYSDCDLKLFGLAVSRYLIDGQSKVVAASAKRQSANRLVESYWKVMVHMARAYITKKQMPRTFWFYATTHAGRMMNAITGKYSGWLASLFLLVYGIRHDKCTWVPLFSLAYFHHEKDGNVQRSKHQAHTMDGIVIGRSPTSNALLAYNPHNKQYYKPDSYHLDPYRLPSLTYPSIKYDSGLFVSLLCHDNPQFEEKYPPGTQVEWINPGTNMLVLGTVVDIPFPIDVSGLSKDSIDLRYLSRSKT
jgi:hypothetical protein